MTTEQYQIGYEAGYSDGFDACAAQAAQPAQQFSWADVGKLIEVTDQARAAGLLVGTSNWGAFVCKAMGAQPLQPGWLPIESAPKDGSSVLLRIEDGDHPLQDANPSISIGSYGTEGGPEHDPTWNFAGWSWEQDCYCRGTGTPTGWMPAPPAVPTQQENDNG